MIEYAYIIIFGLAFYSPAIFYKYSVDDDRCYLWKKPKSGHIYKFGDHGRSALAILSFLRHRLMGSGTIQNLCYDHLFTVILHVAVSCLVYMTFNNLAAAFMFLVHPSTNQVSVWTNGKRYGIVTLCALVALAFPPWGMLAACIAPFFQITALCIPALYIFYPDYYLCVAAFVLSGVVWFPMLKAWYMNRKNKISSADLLQFKPKKLVVSVKTFGFYFIQAVISPSNDFYPDYLQGFGVKKESTRHHYKINYPFYLGLACLCVWAVAMASPIYRLPAYWFMAFIFPWLNFVSVTQELADRYLYCALVGACVCLSVFLGEYAWYAVIYYAVRMMYVMPMYQSRDDFLDYQLYYNPGSPRAYVFKCYEYLSRGEYVAAYYWSLRGVARFEKDCDINICAGRCSAHLGLGSESIKYCMAAYKNLPTGAEGEALAMVKAIMEFNRDNNQKDYQKVLRRGGAS